MQGRRARTSPMLQQATHQSAPETTPLQQEPIGPSAKGSNQQGLQTAGLNKTPPQPPSDPKNLPKTLREMGPTGSVVLDAMPLKESLRVARALRDVPWVGSWLQENDTDRGSPLPGEIRKMAEQIGRAHV